MKIIFVRKFRDLCNDEFDVESVLKLFIRKKIRIMNIFEEVDKIQEHQKNKNDTKDCNAINLDQSLSRTQSEITPEDTGISDASLSQEYC